MLTLKQIVSRVYTTLLTRIKSLESGVAELELPTDTEVAELIGDGSTATAYTLISVTDSGSAATQELAPNKVYKFPNRTSALTLTLGTATSGIASEYHAIILTGSTAPSVTFPSGLSWVGGSAPTIAANKTYEISIVENIAVYVEL